MTNDSAEELSSNTIRFENEAKIEEFEQKWLNGLAPRIEDYLPTDAGRIPLLTELILAEMEFRFKQNQHPKLEEYLSRFPELLTDRLHAIQLATNEFRRLLKIDRDFSVADYVARFPFLSPELEKALSQLEKENCQGNSKQESKSEFVDPLALYQPEDNLKPSEVIPAYIGRFRVESILGRGGFGVVYLAFDEQLERRVAIKLPHLRFVQRPEDREIYLKEARLVASLEHPNIVPVHEVGSTPEYPVFIVSKYIIGHDLAMQLKRATPSFLQATQWIIELADALRAAHKQGIVHRDIKPQNTMIDQEKRVYLVDFGLALRDEDVGKRMLAGGTPAYMSPEQARGEGHRVDGRSDVFSLGIIFYELLSGRRPFQGDSQSELFEQITQLDPKPLRQWNELVPMELDRICFKMLAKRKSERYSSARDLVDDLQAFLANSKSAPLQSAANRPSETNSADTQRLGQTPTPHPVTPTSGSGPLKIMPKGLRSFDHRDADFFLELLPGPRDRDGLPESIGFWKSRLEERDADQTFAVGLIYGPSGCGKSSMMKAGLLPRLSPDIVSIYLEATVDDTERTLLAMIRKKLPGMDAESTPSLVDLLHESRLGRILPSGKKLVIVIDQFEQWLFAHTNAAVEPLLESILQCDGSRVQAIVMVRDDFWMAATRFFRDLDIRLVEGTNSAAVDLFNIAHAERVLRAFGRAFGTLEWDDKEEMQDRKQFITDSVLGLSEEGKVISVRLSLFAETMKGRPWTPESLREVGGTKGIGATFLEETFSSSGAPPQHRYHQEAARLVLRALLPEVGTDIKGHKRSTDELRSACKYENRLRDFEDLIRILDSELRLITPVDSTEALALASNTSEIPTTRSRLAQASQAEPTSLMPITQYQLTHDYLVQSLRDWLTRKQRETRRGRAELKLDERSAAWNAKRESKQLPTLLEWIDISMLSAKRQWSEPKRIMMRNATRLHLTRIGFVSMFVVAASMLMPILIESQRETKRLQELRVRVVAIEDEIQALTVDDLSSPILIEKLTKLGKDDRESYSRLSPILDRRQYQLLEEVLKQPRLSIAQFDQLDSLVSTVRSQENRQILQDRLEKRRFSWNEVLSYSPQSESWRWNLPPVSSGDKDLVVVFDSKKLSIVPGPNSKNAFSLVSLPVRSETTEQLTVEFNEDWSNANRIGLYLDGSLSESTELIGWVALMSVGKSLGKTHGDGELDNFNLALTSNTPIVFQLMRSQEAIIYQEIDPSEIVGKPLRLRFQRVGDEFILQVNQRPELRFDECFSMRSNGVGAPGILWPRNVSINSILLEGTAVAKDAQPLDQADELYRRGSFDDALNLYTTLRTQSSNSELNDECLFKVGLTYAQLQNMDSAANAFQELIEGAKSKWSIRAGCELLKIRGNNDEFAESVGVLQLLRAKFQPSEVSKYVSIDSRNALADLLKIKNVRANWIQRKNQLERTQFVADVYEAIDRPLSDKVELKTNLFQIKSTQGDINETVAEAREFALSIVNNPKASQLDIERVVETWLYMAMNAGVRDGGDEFLGLAEKRVASIVNSNPNKFLKFRAQLANFMNRYSEALDYCHRAKLQWHGESPDYQAELLTGWIHHSMGNEIQAKETWKSAFLQHKDKECVELAVSMMGSLSDTISPTTADQMFSIIVQRDKGEPAINFLGPYVPMPLIRQGARYMWQTEYGKDMARRIGTSQCSFREHKTGQLTVTLYYFLKQMTLDAQGVFDLTPRDFDSEIRTSCETMRTGFEEGRLGQLDFLPLGIAYLIAFDFGFNGVTSNKNFSPQEKAIIGHCLGCHMLRESRKTEAKKAFKLGTTSSTPVIAKLSAEKLQELER